METPVAMIKVVDETGLQMYSVTVEGLSDRVLKTRPGLLLFTMKSTKYSRVDVKIQRVRVQNNNVNWDQRPRAVLGI